MWIVSENWLIGMLALALVLTIIFGTGGMSSQELFHFVINEPSLVIFGVIGSLLAFLSGVMCYVVRKFAKCHFEKRKARIIGYRAKEICIVKAT